MFALINTYPNGNVFPVEIAIATSAQAEKRRSWMLVGQSQFDNWSVITMEELRSLLHAGRVDLGCFTAEAQAEKRRVIEECTK